MAHAVHRLPLFGVRVLLPDLLLCTDGFAIFDSAHENRVVPVSMNLVDNFIFERRFIVLLHLSIDLELLLCEESATREINNTSLLLIWKLYAVLIRDFSDRHCVTNVDISPSNDQVMGAHHGHLDFVALFEVIQVEVHSILLCQCKILAVELGVRLLVGE